MWTGRCETVTPTDTASIKAILQMPRAQAGFLTFLGNSRRFKAGLNTRTLRAPRQSAVSKGLSDQLHATVNNRSLSVVMPPAPPRAGRRAALRSGRVLKPWTNLPLEGSRTSPLPASKGKSNCLAVCSSTYQPEGDGLGSLASLPIAVEDEATGRA
jgi:hypothetical protein